MILDRANLTNPLDRIMGQASAAGAGDEVMAWGCGFAGSEVGEFLVMRTEYLMNPLPFDLRAGDSSTDEREGGGNGGGQGNSSGRR